MSVPSILKWRDKDDGPGSVPLIQPLNSLSELLAWDPSFPEQQIEFCAGKIALPTCGKCEGLDVQRPRMLACHDLKGGYLEDSILDGSAKDCTGYTFRHWYAIDGFVYFSHNLVTIPPPGWIDAAHLHGVPVLGTFITEWDAGEATCIKMLENKETWERVACQLALLARKLNFEGWLVNIENNLPSEYVARMVLFLEALTREMHATVPGSKVIWYDSITIDGKLDWQDELNEKNEEYFASCDGIWLNYTWKHESLRKSRERVRVCHERSPYDVYAGIDCFGRGTFGGGGMKCGEAVSAILEADLSIALFACAWAYENFHSRSKNSIQNENEDLSNKVPESDTTWIFRSLDKSHFVPSWYSYDDEFINGAGLVASCKKEERDWPTNAKPFYNLSTQALQPCLQCWKPTSQVAVSKYEVLNLQNWMLHHDFHRPVQCFRLEYDPCSRSEQMDIAAKIAWLPFPLDLFSSLRIHGSMKGDMNRVICFCLYKLKVFFPASDLPRTLTVQCDIATSCQTHLALLLGIQVESEKCESFVVCQENQPRNSKNNKNRFYVAIDLAVPGQEFSNGSIQVSRTSTRPFQGPTSSTEHSSGKWKPDSPPKEWNTLRYTINIDSIAELSQLSFHVIDISVAVTSGPSCRVDAFLGKLEIR